MSDILDYRFIDKIKPSRVALIGIAFYCLIFIITPAHIDIRLSVIPFIYIFLGYFFFILGNYMVSFKARNFSVKPLPEKRLNFFLVFLLALSLLGIALRLYDRIIVRGASFGADLFENREALDQQGAGALSVLATLLFPLVYFNFFWVLYNKCNSRLLVIIATALFFFPTVDAFLVGSRSSIFHNLIMLFLILKITNNFKVTWSRLLIGFGFLSGIIYLSLYILEERLSFGSEEFNFDFTSVLYVSAYNFTFAVDKWYADLIDHGSNSFQLFKLMLVQIGQYIAHGILEFNYMYENYNKQGLHTWGAMHFNLYLRVIPLVNLDNLMNFQFTPREGIFTSFFGDVYTDFGWLGMIFMFFWGVLNKVFWIKVKEGRVIFIPAYLFMVYIVFFMPTANLLNGAMGFIILHSLMIPVVLVYMKRVFSERLIEKHPLSNNHLAQ